MTDLHPFVYDILPSITSVAHKRYTKFVEKDDIKQECLAWAIARAGWISQQLNEPELEQRKHNEQKLAWQMSRVAERYCRKEKATRSGYQITDEAYYQLATLGQLLPFVIASVIDNTVLEQAQEMVRDGQPKGSSSPAEGGNLLATLMDIKKAYLELDADDKNILVLRYHENYTLAQIGNILECHPSTADRRTQQALRRLNDELGGMSPWV